METARESPSSYIVGRSFIRAKKVQNDNEIKKQKYRTFINVMNLITEF